MFPKYSQLTAVAYYRQYVIGYFQVIMSKLIPDHGMFWAACNLTYFGFLRLVELTVPNLASFSNALHLNVEDIAVNSDNNPSCLKCL